MKTIKIINLLNKIANKEEVPKKIKKGDKTYKYNGRWEDYYYEPDDDYFFQIMLDGNRDMSLILNDKVEIIEEEKELKKVLEIELLDQCDNWLQNRADKTKPNIELNPYILKTISKNFELLYKKQCEIVDVVNELRKEK